MTSPDTHLTASCDQSLVSWAVRNSSKMCPCCFIYIWIKVPLVLICITFVKSEILKKKMNCSIKLLTLCGHTSEAFCQYAAEHKIDYTSSLIGDGLISHRLISERCSCLKLYANVQGNMQTVQTEYILSHDSKSVCCPTPVNPEIERNKCYVAFISSYFSLHSGGIPSKELQWR